MTLYRKLRLAACIVMVGIYRARGFGVTSAEAQVEATGGARARGGTVSSPWQGRGFHSTCRTTVPPLLSNLP